MPGGRKPKRARNISGLRGQCPAIDISASKDESHFLGEGLVTDIADHVESDSDEDGSWVSGTYCDSSKVNFEEDLSDNEGMDEDNLEEWDNQWDTDLGQATAGLQARLILMTVNLGNDPCDKDWMPAKMRAKKTKREEEKETRPKTYVKGPDVASKSKRTQQRYAAAIKSQGKLDGFISIQKREPWSAARSTISISAIEAPKTDTAHTGTLEANSQSAAHPISPVETPEMDTQVDPVIIRQESTSPQPLGFDGEPLLKTGSSRKRVREDNEEVGDSDSEEEAWEEELRETIQPKPQIRGWKALRDQLQKDLEDNHKTRTLPLSKVQQLIILRLFANLMMKGHKRIQASLEIANQWHEAREPSPHYARRIRALARHYEIYEQLPIEHRGGSKNARSLLYDESIQLAARSWLTGQKISSVTPILFTRALNETILPSLDISLKRPLCERTARRWLVKLGWTRSIIRKGVYMDGHEREDVIKYREQEFLPRMKEFESRMVHFEGPELKRVEPKLRPGERVLMAQWQDESSIHQFDVKNSAWLGHGQQILMKKSKGRLIHISDFVNEHNGRLVVKDMNGRVTREARKIIYPGSNGDAWWDCEQLIKQVKEQAIPVFEEAHPDCQALFIFDQSSAHAALPTDALKAFEMNKGNGGKQRRQRDTIIPMTNPTVELRGMVQKMTTDDGQQKGLQQTLRERGFKVDGMRAKCTPVCPFESINCCMARLLSQQDDFKNQISMLESVIEDAGHKCIFLPKFHCELNPIEMYWGWVKHRYRELPKRTFDEAKKAAIETLDACPTDVIRRFCNRTWRFMSAYSAGLTGKAAAWAVRKQKGHRAVSRSAMLHLEAVLNP